jgi:signal transduction histidine kinase
MHKYLQLLLVEDSEDDATLIIHEIKRGGYHCEFERVEDLVGMEACLKHKHWDVVISDFNLPQFSASAALQAVQRSGIDLPFIVVSGTVGEDVAVQMLHAGAHDYIMKENLRRLVPALERSIRDAALRRERLTSDEVLRTTLEELKKRNYELDNYVYKVSHDLRSPLCSILGLTNLVRYEGDVDIIKDYVGKIEGRIHKLDRFIQSILDHSRMLNTEITVRPVNLVSLITDCLEELKYLPEKQQIDVDIHAQGDAVVHNDAFRLSIVLSNLISNAIKYRNPESVNNSLKFNVVMDEKGAHITVEDNGIGIEQMHLPHIFDMFFRATNRSDGSGLGLYIVKQTMQQIGGSISAESALGEWTRFRLYIPNATGIQNSPFLPSPDRASLSA